MSSYGPEPLPFGPPIITVDVEDWPQSTWDDSLPITERAARNSRRLLAILDDLGVRATMFVLGRFAEVFPGLVREIHSCGHEVASHGFGHVEISKQSRQEFRQDVRCAKDLLEQIIGAPVRGYRAPDFSIVSRSLWALEVLVETGHDYDSSIFPVRRKRYGIPSWPTFPTRVSVAPGSEIVELPIAALTLLRRSWPIGGGGYHRLLPGCVARHAARRILVHRPFVFYCHPYEFDPEEFSQLPMRVPWIVRLHQGLGRGRFEQRFRAFVRQFGGRRAVDFLKSQSSLPRFAIPSFGATQSSAVSC